MTAREVARRATAAAAALLLAVALGATAACDDATDCGADGSGPITFATVKNLTAAQRAELAAGWEKAGHRDQPLRIVVLPATSDEQRAQLAATLQADKFAGSRGLRSGYDVVGLDVVTLPEFAKGGYLQPLDPPRFSGAGFLAAPWRSSFYDRRLYAVPYTTNVGLLYYWASDLVALKRIPDVNTRWQPPDWRTVAAVALDSKNNPQSKHEGYVGQLSRYEGLTVNTMELVWGFGGDLPTPTHPVDDADLDAAAEGLGFLLDGLTTGWIDNAAVDYDEQGSLTAFLEGKAAIMRNWPDAWPTARASTDIRVTALPGDHTGVLGGESLAVARCSPVRATARQFLTFLTGAEQQKWVFRTGMYLPTVAGLYEGDALTGGNLDLRPDFISLLRTSIDNARPRPALPAYSNATTLIQDRVHDALETPVADRPGAQQLVKQLAGDLRR
ncbi:extracellular solute-binding protein [Actinoplanes sp. N902-109]|uniref:extracellular solute-binding protein n=1 Tax=Actinoplanes sp. (strain N902-109) TaxID=649831 RepID=UPI0003295107|nr:extracellular solute-binding protein [Actinoplanes sp. N902-109]AGL17100.1 ABC transporter solute-binding protein [Actinoplanes sp. N902-109]